MKKRVNMDDNENYYVQISGTGTFLCGFICLNQIMKETEKYGSDHYIEARIVDENGNHSDPVAFRDENGWTLLGNDVEVIS